MEIKLNKVNDGVLFEGIGATPGVKVQVDGPASIGGVEGGVRPMELVLMALGSCSALDLVSILQKQRQVIRNLEITVKGLRREEIPQIFTKIHMVVEISGELNESKVLKAAELAVKKYCSVHDMLVAGGIEITYEVKILY